MDIQSVPKVGISSVVHSKHIDADNIDVVDNDIALFDTESVISLYNGPTKLEVLTVGLCLEGTGTFKISLREFQLCPGLMVRPMLLSMNSPLGPTVSSKALNSGCMKSLRSWSMEASICPLKLSS